MFCGCTIVLTICDATAAIFITAIGGVAASPLLVGSTVFLADFCIRAPRPTRLRSPQASTIDCRATGLSWANGVGHTGSILGSTNGGVLLTMNLSMSTIVLIVGLPALIGGAAIFLCERCWPKPLTLPPHGSATAVSHRNIKEDDART